MNIQRIPGKFLFFALIVYLCLLYFPFVLAREAAGDEAIQGDSIYYRAMIVSMLEDGDLLLANNIAGNPLDGQLALGSAGLVPKHPILMPAVSLPFYALFGDSGLLLFNILSTLALILLIFLLNALFFERWLAALTTIIYATATLFLDYAYNYSPDVFASVLLLGGLYLVLRQRMYSGALLLGLSVFAKTPNALLAGPILLYALAAIWRNHGSVPRSRRLARMAIIAAMFLLALLPFLYTNYVLFGSPLVTGYQRAAVAGPNGQVQIDDHVAKFNQPLLHGIFQTLFDPRNGILPSNPVVLLALPGALWIGRSARREQLLLILALCLAQFLFFAKYDEWRASHFSNRFLMTSVALSSVFVANALRVLAERFTEQPE